MTTTAFSTDYLIGICDNAFPTAGSAGFLTLLSGGLATGLGYTANSTTNELTTVSAHGLVTGSRVRMVGGTLPSPLLTNVDYFANVLSPTVLRLSVSLADAVANTVVDLTTAGGGGLTLTEQVLKATDPLSVLVNKEVVHPSWPSRLSVVNLGGAINVGGVATKPTKTFDVNNTSASQVLSYQHYLFVNGGTAVLGNVPSGVGFVLSSEALVQVINPGDAPRAVFFKLRARNV
jgi:hypothetical protein